MKQFADALRRAISSVGLSSRIAFFRGSLTRWKVANQKEPNFCLRAKRAMGANYASSILLALLVNASVLQPDADELRWLFFGQVFKERLVAGHTPCALARDGWRCQSQVRDSIRSVPATNEPSDSGGQFL